MGLKNYHSTTTSHVHFVMKMASNQRKGDDKNSSLVAKYEALQRENAATPNSMKSLKSRLEKLTFTVGKGSKEGSE